MLSSDLSTLLSLATLLTRVTAHGTVSGIVAGGIWYRGYSPQFQWLNPIPVVAGWSVPKGLDNGFVNDYTSPDINCHREATPGGAYVKVAAGATVELQWTPWPDSHHGPVLNYLAPCGSDCATFDKTTALWNKIDEAGLINYNAYPGRWAADNLIANNNSWLLTIPASIAPGKYVLRHEIIALHEANRVGGAQNYPQCVNLEISGSGTNNLASTGTLGAKLYTQQDPGIFVNIYQTLASYVIPGPPVLGGGPVPSQSSKPSSSAVRSATSQPPASSASGAPTTLVSVTSSKAAPSGGPTGSVVFSGTVTGPLGAPTKFTCYKDEL